MDSTKDFFKDVHFSAYDDSMVLCSSSRRISISMFCCDPVVEQTRFLQHVGSPKAGIRVVTMSDLYSLTFKIIYPNASVSFLSRFRCLLKQMRMSVMTISWWWFWKSQGMLSSRLPRILANTCVSGIKLYPNASGRTCTHYSASTKRQRAFARFSKANISYTIYSTSFHQCCSVLDM